MIITGKRIDRILLTDLNLIFQLKVSDKEFESLNRCDRNIRYKYVMKRVADTETIWTLAKNESTVGILIYEGQGLFPMWSSREFGEAFCQDMDPNYICLPLSLDDFVEYFIDFICEEDLLINIFPTTNEPIGKIVDINEFAEYLNKELEDYQ